LLPFDAAQHTCTSQQTCSGIGAASAQVQVWICSFFEKRAWFFKKSVFFSIRWVKYPEPRPIAIEAIVKAIANLRLIIPVSIIKPLGLINGEEVRKAIIGPQGKVVVSIPKITAIVPQAQSGVNAPTATLAKIETLVFRSNVCLSFSGSIYTVIIATISTAKEKKTQKTE